MNEKRERFRLMKRDLANNTWKEITASVVLDEMLDLCLQMAFSNPDVEYGVQGEDDPHPIFTVRIDKPTRIVHQSMQTRYGALLAAKSVGGPGTEDKRRSVGVKSRSIRD